MITRPLPPLEELKEFLDYNSDTGIFTWKKQVAHTIKVGQKAGAKQSKGYIQIKFKEKKLIRIVFKIFNSINITGFIKNS